jgi:Chaperone of endosialidase
MKNLKCLPTLLSLVFVVVCLQISVSGQSADKIATISASGSTVRWDVAAPYSSLTLTVSAPDDQVFRREFKAGSTPEFTLVDKDGSRLPDGQYKYELRLTPEISAEVKKALRAAREKSTDDDAAPVREMRKRGMLPTPLIHSGAFQVVRGTVIVAGETEGGREQARTITERQQQQQRPIAVPVSDPASRRRNHHLPLGVPLLPDQVIPDDLIVQGSLCVGFDCVNNENFGFDTIRLKENNLRIKFEDTSVGTFPTNDWQLTANDSASGGLSKFSIEDITGARVPFTVEAGATTNSVYVDSTGRVGFRTSTPVLDLHVNTSNTPALRLEQNSSGGFTAQTWDVAGNEANFFVRDVTGGSLLPFRIRPGAPTSTLDISASGEVGIRTASPTSALTIKQMDDSFIGGLHMRRTGVNNDTWALVTGSDNNFYFGYATSASGGDASADYAVQPLVLTTSNRVGIGTSAPDQKLSVNGDASKSGGGSWLAFSDERLKNIKGQFTSGLQAVMQLQPLRYEYRRNNALGLASDGEHVGFGAQQLQKVIPEAVTKTESGYLMVNNDPIIWTMLNAIKEQQKEIEQLKAQIRQLQPRAGNRTRNRRR